MPLRFEAEQCQWASAMRGGSVSGRHAEETEQLVAGRALPTVKRPRIVQEEGTGPASRTTGLRSACMEFLSTSAS